MNDGKLTFPQKLRLKNLDHFFQNKGLIRRIKYNDWVILYQQNSFAFPRLAVIIPKSNFKKAVRRNRIRRIIKENVRIQQTMLSGYDVIVKCYAGLDKLSNQEIHEELIRVWEKLASNL